jgi:hypothetical protein
VFFSGSSSSTSLTVTTGAVPISVGQVITGTGFSGGQSVRATSINGIYTTITLSAVPNTTPSGTFTFTSPVLSSISTNVATISGIVNNVSVPTPSITPPITSVGVALAITARTDILTQKTALQAAASTYINNTYPVLNDSGTNSSITSLFNVATNLITNGISTRSTPAYGTPGTLNGTYSHARDALLANISFIAAENNAWIDSQYSGITYNKPLATRDTTYIIEAIVYDLTYGGTQATNIVAKQFWYNGLSQIESELTQAVWAATVQHAQQICALIIGNSTVTPLYQGVITQTKNSLWADGGAAASDMNVLFNLIRDVIVNNTVYTPSYPVLTGFTAGLQSARNIIVTNLTTISASVNTYLTTTYPGGFSYNQATCYRDIGYIIDAMSIDLVTGGTYQSISSGLSYYSNTSARVAIGPQYSQTVDGIVFARDLALQVLNQTTAQRFQTLSLQVLNGSYTASSGAKTTFTTNMNTIVSIINLGYGAAPTPSFGTGVYTLAISNGINCGNSST